jgi:hypothetical protein
LILASLLAATVWYQCREGVYGDTPLKLAHVVLPSKLDSQGLVF